nr:MAG TPA: hypothetical protein [Caudoviricetes sp.]
MKLSTKRIYRYNFCHEFSHKSSKIHIFCYY